MIGVRQVGRTAQARDLNSILGPKRRVVPTERRELAVRLPTLLDLVEQQAFLVTERGRFDGTRRPFHAGIFEARRLLRSW
jgi:hypothetical protein